MLKTEPNWKKGITPIGNGSDKRLIVIVRVKCIRRQLPANTSQGTLVDQGGDIRSREISTLWFRTLGTLSRLFGIRSIENEVFYDLRKCSEKLLIQCLRADLKARERGRNRDVVLRSIILAALLRPSLA